MTGKLDSKGGGRKRRARRLFYMVYVHDLARRETTDDPDEYLSQAYF